MPKRKAIFLVVTIGLFLYTTSIGIKNIFRYNDYKLKYEARAAYFQKLVSENQTLNSQLHDMSQSDYWEWLIKKRLGYVFSDERVVFVVNEKEKR